MATLFVLLKNNFNQLQSRFHTVLRIHVLTCIRENFSSHLQSKQCQQLKTILWIFQETTAVLRRSLTCLLHFIPDSPVFIIHVVWNNQFMHLCTSKFLASIQTCLYVVFILRRQKFKCLDFCTIQCILHEI